MYRYSINPNDPKKKGAKPSNDVKIEFVKNVKIMWFRAIDQIYQLLTEPFTFKMNFYLKCIASFPNIWLKWEWNLKFIWCKNSFWEEFWRIIIIIVVGSDVCYLESLGSLRLWSFGMLCSVTILKITQMDKISISLIICVFRCSSMFQINVIFWYLISLSDINVLVLDRDDSGMIMGRLIRYPPVEDVTTLIRLAHEDIVRKNSFKLRVIVNFQQSHIEGIEKGRIKCKRII